MRSTGLLLMLCVSCADVTEVRVRLLADDTIAAAARELRVSVRGEDDDTAERVVRVGEDGSFPFEIPVVPRGGDSSRSFELFAELVDERGESLGTQRVLANFAEGEQRIIERTFSESCGTVRCAAGRTCTEGACVSACVLAEGADVPSGCSGNICEERGLVAENFEDTDSWPACPDFDTEDVGTCMASRDEHVFEVVDARTQSALLSAPPCGSRILRLVAGDVTSGAYLALPTTRGARWMRAMVYTPAANLEILEAAVNSQALMRWSNGTNVNSPDQIVDLRWGPESTSSRWRTQEPLMQGVSGSLPQIPSDEWTCIEFFVDPDARQAQVGFNGVLTAPNESEIADLFDEDVVYAAVGLFMGTIPTTLYVDDIVVSNERIPCP